MKTISKLVLALSMLITLSVTAQQGINYKALIKDGSGNVIANDLIVVQFTILQGVAETNVYQETFTPTTDANGIVILNIGEGTIVSGVFSDIDWGSDTHALKVEINTGGGLIDMGTTQFKTVPYALSSADNQWFKTGNDIENTNTGKVAVNGSLEVGTTINLELGTTVNEISIDGTLADNSDDAIPTEKAVKTYVDNSNFNNTVTKIDDLTDGKSDANGSSLFLGVDAGLNDDGSANRNVGVGFNALFSNATGASNTAIGSNALYSNTVGWSNTTIGAYALSDNTDGYQNTAIGFAALALNTTGRGNTASGYLALYNNDNGGGNTANGLESLFLNTDGFSNTANGWKSLYSNTLGNQNTAIGSNALNVNTIGNQNTAIGTGALGANTSGSNNTAIGFTAIVPDGTLDNQVRIGNHNVTYAGVQVAWDVTSDKRWKDNIRTLPYGLAFVKQLQPVDYVRKNNDAKTREMGFIAQDVETLLTKIGYDDQGFLHKDDKGFMSLRYNDFIALLTKAIQEQQEIIEEQNSKLKEQDSDIKILMARMQKIENVNGIN